MENTNNNKNIYENAKIYMVTDNAYTEKYIGATTQELSSRMAGHRKKYIAFKNGKCRYVTIFDIFDKYGIENCKIELILETPCETKNQLRKIEGEHIRKEDCVNKRIEDRDRKEYAQTYKDKARENTQKYKERNKDVLAQKQQEFRSDNKEKLRELRRQQYENDKERLNEKIPCTVCKELFTRSYMTKHVHKAHEDREVDKEKEYRENNKDRIKATLQEWYKKKKEFLSEKIPCETCNKYIARYCMTRHKKIHDPK